MEFTKNCFYSDTENKACDDSFVLHIAVNTNVSEGFVFTAISSTNQITCQNSNICCGVSSSGNVFCHFVLHIAVNTNVSEGFVVTAIWSTCVEGRPADRFVLYIAVNTSLHI